MYITKQIDTYKYIKSIPNIVILFAEKHLYIDVYAFKWIININIHFHK